MPGEKEFLESPIWQYLPGQSSGETLGAYGICVLGRETRLMRNLRGRPFVGGLDRGGRLALLSELQTGLLPGLGFDQGRHVLEFKPWEQEMLRLTQLIVTKHWLADMRIHIGKSQEIVLIHQDDIVEVVYPGKYLPEANDPFMEPTYWAHDREFGFLSAVLGRGGLGVQARWALWVTKIPPKLERLRQGALGPGIAVDIMAAPWGCILTIHSKPGCSFENWAQAFALVEDFCIHYDHGQEGKDPIVSADDSGKAWGSLSWSRRLGLGEFTKLLETLREGLGVPGALRIPPAVLVKLMLLRHMAELAQSVHNGLDCTTIEEWTAGLSRAVTLAGRAGYFEGE